MNVFGWCVNIATTPLLARPRKFAWPKSTNTIFLTPRGFSSKLAVSGPLLVVRRTLAGPQSLAGFPDTHGASLTAKIATATWAGTI